MARPRELNQADFERIVNDAVDLVSKYCYERGLPPSAVVSTLFAAAGTFGYCLADHHAFLDEIRTFLRTTRKLYPDFTFDYDPYLGYWKHIMQYAALQEKSLSTVH